MPSINEIIGQEAFDQVTRLKAEMKDLVGMFENSSKAATLLEKALSKADGFRATVEAMDKLSRTQQKVAQSTDELIIKTAKVEDAYREFGTVINDKQKQELEAILAAKQHAEEEKKLAEQLLKQVNSIKQATEANKLLRAERDKLNFNTEQGRKKIEELNTSINKNTELIRANTDAAKKQSMDVGNYAKGFSSMNSAVSQITREMPNFAMSMQTGIMSLTNNIGAFQDAVARIRESNKALAAEGKPTVSVLSQIGSAIFSWPTLIMAAVTAVTAYSKEIAAWTKNLFNASDAQKSVNEAIAQGLKDATAEISHLDRLYEKATNVAESTDQRRLSAEKMQDLYPTIFKSYTTEQIMLGKAKTAYDELRESIIKTSKIKALEGKITETINEGIDKELELQKRYDDRVKKAADQRGKIENPIYHTFRSPKNQTEADFVKMIDAQNEATVKAYKKELEDYQKLQADKLNVFTNAINKIGDVKTAKELEQDQKELEREQKKTAKLEEELKRREEELAQIRKNIQEALLFDKNWMFLNGNPEEDIKDILNYYKKIKEGIEAGLKEMFKGYLPEEDPLVKQEMDKLVMPTSDSVTAANLTNEINNRKKPKAQKNALKEAKAELKTLMDLAKTTQQAINDITTMLADRANAEADRRLNYIDKVEKAQLSSLSRMSLSEDERAEKQKRIEIEAEARRDKIEKEKIKKLRKYAAVQKAVDISQITLQTYLSIQAAMADKTVPYPVRVGYAISAGIQGAANIAKAAATPLPQYEKGTESHKGGKAIMGDGYEHELVQQPDGKVWITDNKPTVYDLPTGSSVIPLGTDILAMAQTLALQKLAIKGGVVNSNDYTTAYIKSFEELSGKVDTLTNVMKNKEMSVKFYGSREYLERINKNW